MLNDHAILEPLSEATEDAFRNLPLKAKEHLVVGIDDEHSFVIYAKTLEEATEEDVQRMDSSKIITADDGRIFKEAYGWMAPEVDRFFKNIPDSKPMGYRGDWKRMGWWSVPQTDYTVVMIHAAWPKDRILFLSDEARISYSYLLRRFMAQSTRAVMQAEFKVKGTTPEYPKDYSENNELPLAPAQKAAMLFGLGQEGTALFMDKGTGKTATAIARVCAEAKRTMLGTLGGGRPHMMRVLCVVQNKARLNWQKEYERFANVPGKVVILRGGKLQRLKLLQAAITTESDCAWSSTIASYDTVSKDIDILERVEWDLIICDESHNFKNWNSQRWKALKRLREKSLRRQILTGSPIGNHIFDLYTQLEFLYEGASGFKNFKSFRSWHGKFVNGVADATGHSVEKLVGLKNVPLLQERLSRLSFSLTKAEAGLHLPDKVYDMVEVSMTPTQTDYYRKIATQLALEIEKFMETSTLSKSMTTNHILTRLLRLAQITSGFVKWNAEIDPETGETVPGTGTIEQIPGGNPKIDALLEELQDPDNDPNEKTIVWCIWREDLRAVCDALTEKGIKFATIHGGIPEKGREQAEYDFNNDPSVKVLVCNPQTAGDSLNLVGYDWQEKESKLPTYTGHEIYFSCNWSYLMRTQSEDRAHRRGTRKTVRITDIVVPGTIDEDIRERVKGKEQMALEIQDIREILKRVLEFEGGIDE